MGRFLDEVRDDHPAYRLESGDDGLTLIRRRGREDEFNRLARSLIDGGHDDVVVFPTPDDEGYERVFVVPL
ncbi:hypothetical protein E4M02_06025 [Brevundimonas sp. S30B]|uniref:hypothetical protein n=1 Tax=unclassified Brevundimonas TaxID=2622653 RepID=UPI0010718738|nr:MULTISPECIES: hypothetical protein [unclassified Brevundimonas]QBX38088.1 hypothetical protein E4M01_10115 [Brevundimonas sp. MF30-B]TFW02558.1 hypothetical protein E4M02_06025 [Brevundimonas sp. S30B]